MRRKISKVTVVVEFEGEENPLVEDVSNSFVFPDLQEASDREENPARVFEILAELGAKAALGCKIKNKDWRKSLT